MVQGDNDDLASEKFAKRYTLGAHAYVARLAPRGTL